MWAEFIANFAKWLQIVCYLALVGVAFDFLQYLPPDLANRLIEAALGRLGI